MEKAKRVYKPAVTGFLRGKLLIFLVWFIKGLEYLGSKWIPLGRFYGQLFYSKMIAAEAKLAGLKPGMKILHIGSGHLPLTAFCLGAWGYEVEALDNDLKAVTSGKKMIENSGLSSNIIIKQGDGTEVNCSDYDAVWISLHVFPKEEVLNRVVSTLKEGGRVIYRNPGGLLKYLYPRMDSTRGAGRGSCRKVKQCMGKETVVLQKCLLEDEDNPLTLDCLRKDQEGIIHYVPDNPLLAPLGLRPGKKVRVCARECFGGPVIAEVERRRVALDRLLAGEIIVKKGEPSAL
ncbi:MAG: hypothetical protein D5R97_10465 [Candidatus Syntrophonatronum acetioxidans]|uniref:Ferrous iron transporter FeoA-like domain-containing protein n=1 Tax=Candidatus Syntrophonatronum acetioxidans TaxID=1795816 RepID=A0A424Y9V4_9FIRM|nr:MAG: hypothetical protein D5R97_10465 [Candidatus Syntrophonatronum acetioxidans]